jgi:multisubunit Na+/H+ antiporter MnhC subunit
MSYVVTTDVSYGAQLPGLILSGIGMALFFAPAANLVMSSVRPAEQGIASGANNALREVGGALGVAVMASIFSAQGGYQTGQTFVDGLKPALVTGAAVVALAGIATLLIPTRRRAAELAAVSESGESTEPAESVESADATGSGPVLESAGH